VHTLGYVTREQAVPSCPTLPYPTLPYPTLPCPTLPYPTLPYPIVSIPSYPSYAPFAAATVTASAQRVYLELKLLVVGAS